MKLLHIIATPRENESNTLRVSDVFLQDMQTRYPELVVDVIDLFQHDLPAVAGNNIESKYTLLVGKPIDKRHKESWEQIEGLIKHFLSADIYLISTPMWNFSIPYTLKYYIDAIVQPGYLYRYNERGLPIPLTHGKKMVCITSRGGDYSEHSPLHVYDFQEAYLRAIFGFVGITDNQFINLQPMDVTLDLREAAISAGLVKAHAMVADSDWESNMKVVEVENLPALKPRPI
jgi:FMN-dependent NADH-azoreductase